MLSKKTLKYLSKHNSIDIKDKLVVITGANSGVGYQACLEVLELGASLLMACRNMEKAEQARQELLKMYPKANIMIYALDLASKDSIKNFAARIKRNKLDIYAFVNNAGAYRLEHGKTVDGFETIMGINYLGVYNLIERLIPYFKTLPHTVKLLNQVSISYKYAKINYNDFFMEKHYNKLKIYSKSKLCLIKYSIYLANKLMDSNIEVTMTHPGVTKTPLMEKAYLSGYRRLFKPFFSTLQSPEKSALAIPYILTNEVRSGTLIGPTKFFGFSGYPKINKIKKNTYNQMDRLIKFTDQFF